MKYFDNFSWAIPLVYEEALAACFFQEGDALYDARKAYELEWGEALPHIKNCIHVRRPARASAGTGGMVFERNWNSDALVEVSSPNTSAYNRFVRTTQGRLYSALWHGDLTLLEGGSPPKCPRQLRHIVRKVSKARPFINARSTIPAFVMAIDRTNAISRQKYQLVSSALRKQFGAKEHTASPKEVGVESSERVVPTVSIVWFAMDTTDHASIKEALKKVLYTPSKGAKTSKFRLDTHGSLIV